MNYTSVRLREAPDGSVMEDEGDTVVIWKLGEDGAWLLHVDIWNTSLPLP
jgi:ketosteroid isomerase-like protein